MNTTSVRYILYADDDVDDQEALSQIVDEIDAQVRLVSVNNGNEVIEYLESLQTGDFLPCLILLDLNMPLLNGMETLKKLKEDATFTGVPVIIFSTAGRENHVDFAKSLGAVDYIQKPFNIEKFKAVTNNFVDHCETVPEQKRYLLPYYMFRILNYCSILCHYLADR